MTHTYYSFTFTDKEIDMICNLVKLSSNGYIQPIKRATLTRNVIQYAIHWGLLEVRGSRVYFPQFSGFNPVYDLPVEALWRMVKPMLNSDGSTGYSIVNNERWEDLNIYPQRSRHASDRDLEAKTDILLKLSSHHYIHFQLAGTTGCIYPENERMLA